MAEVQALPGEVTLEWNELTERQKGLVAQAHLVLAPGRPATIRRLLELAGPKIIFGSEEKYCRIHQDSVDVVKVIFRQYL